MRTLKIWDFVFVFWKKAKNLSIDKIEPTTATEEIPPIPTSQQTTTSTPNSQPTHTPQPTPTATLQIPDGTLSVSSAEETKEWLEDLKVSIQKAFADMNMEETRTASVHTIDENQEHIEDATNWALDQKKNLK